VFRRSWNNLCARCKRFDGRARAGELSPVGFHQVKQVTVDVRRPAERSTWTGAGAGVQLTIVTAKFEVGYMRTVSGPTFGARGNLFARPGFERLF